MNSFVRYLDQFNVLSPNHSKIYDEYSSSSDEYSIKIETKIEQFLIDIFLLNPRSVIMTGNAGDGKTRLCRSVYEKITGSKLEQWPESGIIDVPFDKGTIRIVKDLSELTESIIYEELDQLQSYMIDHHEKNVYFLIAANEGKLTKFLSQHPSLNDLYFQVRNRFLDYKNNDSELHLVNLQDVTSSIYAERILELWNKEENWTSCNACPKQNRCIISLNHRRMSQDRVMQRLVEQYRLIDCLGIHITMREILIHLSYVITGGLTCEDVLQADYEDMEKLSDLVYYENFYGTNIPESSTGEMGAIRHFKRLNPGEISISMIDDFLLNGDISGDDHVVNSHNEIFNEEVDMLFGYYRKLIDLYRTHNPHMDQKKIFEKMSKFRRKYFFETNEQNQDMRKLLIPYRYFYRYLDGLSNKQSHSLIRRELIQGLNAAFSKKLVSRSETQLFAVNENLMIHQVFSVNQIKLVEDAPRVDIDYEPSRFFISVNHETILEIKLPVFEYLLRLASGGLFVTLKQEVEILLNTFKNDLIKKSELEEYILSVFALDPQKGVYTAHNIDID
ncbi:hypothetical protein [Paenibacillus sp. OAS669]|uniref:hypothetical protein n=1 Tax=Paenibacillus sp. OAS669 TaxID=2663821 RepID=UPI001789D93B|nr:hypothetical protein [Paenibacillus sp. OAS669]MBE1444856.1 hypothetical protein [Paenibacillus sp. OAS669]